MTIKKAIPKNRMALVFICLSPATPLLPLSSRRGGRGVRLVVHENLPYLPALVVADQYHVNARFGGTDIDIGFVTT